MATRIQANRDDAIHDRAKARAPRRLLASAATALALALLTVSGGGAHAQSLVKALETAVDTSPEIKAQLATLLALNEDVAIARAGFRPNVSVSGSTGASITDSSESFTINRTLPNSVTATIEQPLFDGFQTDNAIRAALASLMSARANLRQIEQTVLLNAVTAYITVLQAEQNVRLSRNDVEVVRRSLEAARDRFEVGEVTLTDVSQAEASLAESQANLAEAKNALRAARERYYRAVGVRPGKLAQPPRPPVLPNTLEDAIARAKTGHPRIVAARATVSSATFSIAESRGALLPSASLSASGTAASDSINRGSGVFSGDVTLNVRVPIYQGGALRGSVRRNKAVESQRFEELRDVTREVLESVAIAWEDLVTSKELVKANRVAVKAQRIALDGVREEERVGQRTTLDVLDAQQRVLDAEVALLNSETELKINVYRVLEAMGELSIETLGLDIARPDIEEPYQGSQDFPTGTAIPKEDRDEDWLHDYKH